MLLRLLLLPPGSALVLTAARSKSASRKALVCSCALFRSVVTMNAQCICRWLFVGGLPLVLPSACLRVYVCVMCVTCFLEFHLGRRNELVNSGMDPDRYFVSRLSVTVVRAGAVPVAACLAARSAPTFQCELRGKGCNHHSMHSTVYTHRPRIYVLLYTHHTHLCSDDISLCKPAMSSSKSFMTSLISAAGLLLNPFRPTSFLSRPI